MKSRDSEDIALNRAAFRNPFFAAWTVVLYTGKTGVEATGLLFGLDVTRELLFFGISEGV